MKALWISYQQLIIYNSKTMFQSQHNDILLLCVLLIDMYFCFYGYNIPNKTIELRIKYTTYIIDNSQSCLKRYSIQRRHFINNLAWTFLIKWILYTWKTCLNWTTCLYKDIPVTLFAKPNTCINQTKAFHPVTGSQFRQVTL